MRRAEILGFLAGALSASTFFPVAVSTYRDPHPDTGTSVIASYSIYLSAASLWVVYGLVVRSPSIVASNSLAASVVVFILVVLAGKRGRDDAS